MAPYPKKFRAQNCTSQGLRYRTADNSNKANSKNQSPDGDDNKSDSSGVSDAERETCASTGARDRDSILPIVPLQVKAKKRQ